MIVFCNANGTVTSVLPSPVYQGSALSGGLYFLAPVPKTNSVTVAFELADGTVTDSYLLTPVIQGLENIVDTLGETYSVWEWQTSNKEITAQAGTVTAQFYVGYFTGKEGDSEFQVQASAKVSFTVQKGVIPLPTETPSANQWDTLIALYSEIKGTLDKIDNIDGKVTTVTIAANATESYAQKAHDSESAAATSESNALTYKTAAETAKDTATAKAQEASESATAAAASATEAQSAANTATEKAAEATQAAENATAVTEQAINARIVQTTGQSTDKIMSQKAVTTNIERVYLTPELRNGSLGNPANTNAVGFKYTQEIKDKNVLITYDIDLADGETMMWNMYTYDSIGALTDGSLSEANYRPIVDLRTVQNYIICDFSEAINRGKKSYGVSLFVLDADGNSISQRVETNAKNIIVERYATIEKLLLNNDNIYENLFRYMNQPYVRDLKLRQAAWTGYPYQQYFSTKRVSSEMIPVKSDKYTLSLSLPEGIVGGITAKDDQDHFTNDYAWYENGSNIIYLSSKDKYISIVFKKTNEENITIDEVLGRFTLSEYHDIEKRYDLLTAKKSRHVNSSSNKPLTIAHLTDVHADSGAYNRIVSDIKSLGNGVDDAICTGDVVGDTFNEDISTWWTSDVMTCIGNHDSATYDSSTGYDWTALTMVERSAKYIEPWESDWGIVHTAGTSYYYKDYADSKVRMIVLDNMLYMGTSTTAEATEQTAWLAETMESAITLGYHVLIAVHAVHGGSVAVPCSFSKYGYDSSNVQPTQADCNLPSSVIDTVSTAITNGCKFIGYICGHNHQDTIWDATGDRTQLMYCATCANQKQKAQWQNADLGRYGIDDSPLDAYNLITISTSNHLIKIVRCGGADIDDYMRPRKQICVDYYTGTIVSE